MGSEKSTSLEMAAMFGFLGILIFGVFCFLSYGAGYMDGREDMRKEAISRGYGTYETKEKESAIFKWIEKNPEK